jgi:chromosome segregation ATPase
LRAEAAGAEAARNRAAALEQEVADLARAREEAERSAIAERARATALEARLAEASAPTDLLLQLKAGELREEALKRERERLLADLAETLRLHHATEQERLSLAEKAATTDAVRASLAEAEGRLGEAEADLASTRSQVEDLQRRLAEEEAHRAEHLAKATAKVGVEAKMLRELSERQAAELKELRVQWARGSAELNRLKATLESLQQAETQARTELKALKEGKGVLSAADVAEAMGVDLAHVQRLEQRVRELEAELARRGG